MKKIMGETIRKILDGLPGIEARLATSELIILQQRSDRWDEIITIFRDTPDGEVADLVMAYLFSHNDQDGHKSGM